MAHEIMTALARGLGVKAASREGMVSVNTPSMWWPVIREPHTGAWQRNQEIRVESGFENSTVFRCMGLIASDIAKMRLRLVQQTENGVWQETESPSFSPVLRKPNGYENRIQFISSWVQSKLGRGNTYVLKGRDDRGVVNRHWVLDPMRVKPLVATSGDVYYQLSTDHLAGLPATTVVPASEIIHDRWNTLFHPLVGLSPLYACALGATQGLEIQRQGVQFFRNGSRPGGVLSAPGHIEDDTAGRIKDDFEEKFGGDNRGRTAVLGDGLTYQAMAVTAEASQLVEQLKLTGEQVCAAFGVPAYMVGVGQAPTYNNIEALQQQYYGQCLQILIESIELCLDEGLALPSKYGTEFDLDDLLRMDSATQVKTLAEGVKGGIYKPNEARLKMNLPPVEGGDTVYLQQQEFSLEALAKRDARDDPFATSSPAPTGGGGDAEDEAPDPANDVDEEAQAAKAAMPKLRAYQALEAIKRNLQDA